MRMMRASAMVLAILSQAFSVLAPGALVLCVHNDGRSMVELASAPCCRVEPSDNGAPTSHGNEMDAGPVVVGDVDQCKDSPLCFHHVRSSQKSDGGAQPCSVFPLPPCGYSVRAVHPSSRMDLTGGAGPPHASSIAHLRTVILRR
ncbi:MAG: hypothetical protein AB7F75_08725 [Planctomycetota bacterium]